MSSDMDVEYPVITPGIAIGPRRLSPINGSVGLIVRYHEKEMILSCYHVLVGDAQFKVGDEIGQPSTSGNIVGRLWPEFALTAKADFALAEIVNRKASNQVQGHNIRITKFADEAYIRDLKNSGKRVTKRGTASGVTHGKIVDLGVSTKVNYPGIDQTIMLNGQIQIQGNSPPFSAGGDSGAPVFDDTGVIIGLIVGGVTEFSFATPIYYLLEVLEGITIL